MSKRVDHDATQEVSASMLVPDKKPPVYPNVPKNDASMWMSAPVSADDFVSGPKKKPELRGNRSFVILVFVALVVLLVGGAVFAWYVFLRPAANQTLPVANTPNTPGPPVVDQAMAPAPASDAGVAVAAADAAVAAVLDAGAPVAALQVDAVSAADPAAKKKSTKKRATKKKAVKKKTASKRR
jgi:flagellar basal body-associated protein FliL